MSIKKSTLPNLSYPDISDDQALTTTYRDGLCEPGWLEPGTILFRYGSDPGQAVWTRGRWAYTTTQLNIVLFDLPQKQNRIAAMYAIRGELFIFAQSGEIGKNGSGLRHFLIIAISPANLMCDGGGGGFVDECAGGEAV